VHGALDILNAGYAKLHPSEYSDQNQNKKNENERYNQQGVVDHIAGIPLHIELPLSVTRSIHSENHSF
jgi:hypothetical protein